MDSTSNGSPGRPRPAVPTVLAVASMVVALGAVSALVFVLYQRTEGPGEVLRDMARRLDAGDCPGSYELLHPSARQLTTEAEWCQGLEETAALLPPDFRIDHVVVRHQVADVALRRGAGPPCTWSLRRLERTWGVLGNDCPPAESGD
ncbi:MAG: hypothetical protein M3245_00370 [Actinomycetota bacterium]|nr:hypothetical protein [Actinomycetota bacterium]